MKNGLRAFAMTLALAGFAGVAPVHGAGNLIVNGDFEQAPTPGGDNPKGATFGGTAYYANSVPVGPLNPVLVPESSTCVAPLAILTALAVLWAWKHNR